jgi:hypothetical protein
MTLAKAKKLVPPSLVLSTLRGTLLGQASLRSCHSVLYHRTVTMAQYSHGGYGTTQPPFCGTERGGNYVARWWF